MVKFEIKVHPKQRLAYIPKEIFESLGTRLEVVPDLKGFFAYPKGLSPEQALNSLDAIYRHFKLQVKLEKAKGGERQLWRKLKKHTRN